MVTPFFVGRKLPQETSEAAACRFVCPLCASWDVETYSDDEDQKLAASALGPSRKDISHGKILRCRDCRFGFRRLRPAEEELSTLYRELDHKVYEKESVGRFKTAKRHLRIVQQYVVGSRLLVVAHTATLRVLLAVVIVALAVQMTLHGLAGWI